MSVHGPGSLHRLNSLQVSQVSRWVGLRAANWLGLLSRTRRFQAEDLARRLPDRPVSEPPRCADSRVAEPASVPVRSRPPRIDARAVACVRRTSGCSPRPALVATMLRVVAIGARNVSWLPLLVLPFVVEAEPGAATPQPATTVPSSSAPAATPSPLSRSDGTPPPGSGTAPPTSAASGTAPLKSAPSSCVTCHGQLEGELADPVKSWPSDVHASAGLGCDGCHGGDPSPALGEDATGAMDPAGGFRPPPKRLQVAEACARCHADASFMKRYNPRARVDQLAEYRTSVHGKRAAGGDPTPATCTDCHGAHGIRPVTSPDSPVYATNVPATCARCHTDARVMAPYKIPTNQLHDYRRSVHAAALLDRGDLAAPACNDCHGNHGAAPPGVQSVANVCGQCHGVESIFFRASFKKQLMEDLGVPECSVCHGYHLIRHPTAEMFYGGSAPQVSRGRVTSTDPFEADLGDIEPGKKVTCSWRDVLKPNLQARDRGLVHTVEVQAEGMAPVVLDATIRPGEAPPAIIRAHGGAGSGGVEGSAAGAGGGRGAGAGSGGHTGGGAGSGGGRAGGVGDGSSAGDPGSTRAAGGGDRGTLGGDPTGGGAESSAGGTGEGGGADGGGHTGGEADRRAGAGATAGAGAARDATAPTLLAALTIEPVSGSPVEAGDALVLRLTVEAGPEGPLRSVKVRDLPGGGVDPHLGSACRHCHEPGDKCDRATEKMYSALISLDRELRDAGSLLRRAEVAGMEVSGPLFELKSKGITAAVEARALIHAFEPDRLVKRTAEGSTVAAASLQAGQAALDEVQVRRKGLAVSLVLVGLVALGLFLKIRERAQAPQPDSDSGAEAR